MGDMGVGRKFSADISSLENHYQKKPLGDLVRALILDASRLHSFSKEEEQQLLHAAGKVETYYLDADRRNLKSAIARAKTDLDDQTRTAWDKFETRFSKYLDLLGDAFQETDPEMLAKNCLWLAHRFRTERFGGTAWLLAQLAAGEVGSRDAAAALQQNLEGQRVSTEYLVSDFFEQGGTSLAIHLLSLAPTIALTRKLYRARPLYAFLAGGPIHWASTKSLKLITGYDGRILPSSFGELAGEWGMSYLEASTALLFSHRFFWKVRPPVAAEAAPVIETTGSIGGKLLSSLKRVPEGLWWSTKTSGKFTGLAASDLLTQYVSHLSGLANMTPRGFPQYLSPLFPKTMEIRREVAQGYEVRRTLIAGRLAEAQPGRRPVTPLRGNAADVLNAWIVRAEPTVDPLLSEMLLAELYAAFERGAFGLNIQRWILRQLENRDYLGANQVFERQNIPIRIEKDGNFCLLDSTQYPCKELPDL